MRLRLALIFVVVLVVTAKFAEGEVLPSFRATAVYGIDYERLRFAGATAHVVHVDLAVTEPVVTAPDASGSFPARTVQEHAQVSESTVAINANFFYPFHSHHPWDFAPRSGEVATPLGGVVVDGHWAAASEPDWPMICFNDEHASVEVTCPSETQWGVAGSDVLLRDSAIAVTDDNDVAPRTAVGIGPEGRRVVLVVVDGRQPNSPGLTLEALAELMREQGAVDALALDGGGSSTLVLKGFVVNSPIHTRVPRRQRPVPVHLGFRSFK